jgi:hypothetical protein
MKGEMPLRKEEEFLKNSQDSMNAGAIRVPVHGIGEYELRVHGTTTEGVC